MRYAVLALLIVGGNGYHRPKNAPEATKYQEPRNSLRNASIVFPSVGDLTTADQTTGGYQDAKRYLRKAFGPEYSATWVLVIAAVIGIGYTIRTLKIIRRQTRSIHHQAVQVRKQTRILNRAADGTQKAAEAALLNAQATINAERALIEVDLMEASEEIDPETGDRFIDYKNDFRYGIKITNHGRTVARITSYRVWSDCFSSNFNREDFSHSHQVTRHILLGSDKTERIGDIDFGGLFADWKSIHAKTKTGMLRTDVRYEDVIQAKGHETSAIFRYSVEDEEPIRLPEYNTYT